MGRGTVAIPNNTDVWPTYNRTAAEELIAKQVGPSYRVVSEGEFVKGKSKQLSLDSNSASFTQQKITEYRISFVRMPGPDVPPATPAGTGFTQTSGRGPAPGPGTPPATTPSVPPGGAPQPVQLGTNH